MSFPDRRLFTATAASAFIATTAQSASRIMGANEKIRLGFIGMGNRGDQNLDSFLPHKDVDFVALCDLWKPYLEFAKSKLAKRNRLLEGVLETDDYKQVLNAKNVECGKCNNSLFYNGA